MQGLTPVSSVNSNGVDRKMSARPISPVEDVKVSPLSPIQSSSAATEKSKEILTSIFINEQTSLVSITSQITDDFVIDTPIDDLGHTALHWASALAKLPIVEMLCDKGANPCRVNEAGETPLIRTVCVTNNFDQNLFPRLLKHLAISIPISDNFKRNVLHHIALTSAMKGRSAASKYYLETLLEWVIRNQESNGLNIKTFLHYVVDARDKNGDTPLNIAARIGNKSMMDTLIDCGANASIPNAAGLRPFDFGVGNLRPSVVKTDFVPEAEKDISSLHSQLLTTLKQSIDKIELDFNEEQLKKSKEVDEARIKLREVTNTLRNLRQRLDSTVARSIYAAEVEHRCRNLEMAIEEENAHFNSQRNLSMDSPGSDSVLQSAIDADSPFIVYPLAADGSASHDHTQLPPLYILQARLNAYKTNAVKLNSFSVALKSRSSELEQKYRKVVSLCTCVDESKLDSLLESLLQAVQDDIAVSNAPTDQ